jgi:heme exporter protein CcmD
METMGDYALYVYGAYGLTLAVMIGEVVWLARRAGLQTRHVSRS